MHVLNSSFETIQSASHQVYDQGSVACFWSCFIEVSLPTKYFSTPLLAFSFSKIFHFCLKVVPFDFILLGHVSWESRAVTCKQLRVSSLACNCLSPMTTSSLSVVNNISPCRLSPNPTKVILWNFGLSDLSNHFV